MRRRHLLVSLCSLPHPARAAAGLPFNRFAIPAGYVRVAQSHAVPPRVLFGVALQESLLYVGPAGHRRPLPWPWTLNVAGSSRYYAHRAPALAALQSALARGQDSVDVGAMQVNWHHHHERLGSTELALDPYRNLHVGAAILADRFAETPDWHTAVGRYHAPTDAARARAYADAVFARFGGLTDA